MSILLQQWTRFFIQETRAIHTCAALNAARKGTRSKREAKKKASKKQVIKKVFIPYSMRLEKAKIGSTTVRRDESHRSVAVDNVFFFGTHKPIMYSLSEIAMMHRETADITQYNQPDARLVANIELSMSADKKNKYLTPISNIILLPFPYPVTHKRKIMAICKDEEMVNQIESMNVELAVGPEFQSLVQKNTLDFTLFDYVICHTSLVPNLIPFRNMLKKKMPFAYNGTVGNDLVPLVERYQKGVKYETVQDKYDLDFASFSLDLGPLYWEAEKLEENLKIILRDVEDQRRRKNRVITRVMLATNHTSEKFKLDYDPYFKPIVFNEPEDDAEEVRAEG